MAWALARLTHVRFPFLPSLLSVICIVVYAASASAQSTVVVSGTIRDVSGAALPGAVVEAMVAARVTTTVTAAADGTYRVPVPANVPFTLRIRRAGFTDQVVELGGTPAAITQDVAMAVGGVSDTLVVTAARGAESRTRVTQSVTVATRTDIDALGSTQLSDVLRFMPGVSADGTGREGGGPTSLFVRGGDSDYNVVLIDGVRANLDGGRFDFSRVAAGEIDRIEVVRGAQSSLWGADAMTSVVQIFTKRAAGGDAPQVSGAIESGSFGTSRGNAGVTGGAGTRVDYRLGTTYRRTNGAFADLLPEDDEYRQAAFDGGVGIALGSNATVRTGLRYSDGAGRNPGAITYGARDTGTAYDTTDLSWYTTFSHTLGSRFTGTATANYFRYRNVSADRVEDAPYETYAILTGTPDAIFPDGTRLVRLIDAAEFNSLAASGAPPAPGQFLASAQSPNYTYESLTEFRRPSIRYQGDYAWAAGQRVSVGYDWEREINPNVAGFNLDNNGFFVQHQSTIADRVFVTVGARVDRKERYDTFFSPKLSAGGFLLPFRSGIVSSLKLFGNIGRGVKSPTFTERFGGSFADPNPDIKVEQARSTDLGIEGTFLDQRLRTVVTYFHNNFTDQISNRPGVAGDGIPEYINIDGSRASGWELELALQRPVRGLTASANYSFVDTEVVTNQSTSQQFQPGQPLLRRPKHSGTIRAGYVRGRASVNFNVRLVGDRFDNSFLFLQTVPNTERPDAATTDITVNPGYAVAGLGFDFRAHDALTLFVRGDNIGDTTYDSALGYPGLPRAVVAGARFVIGSRR